jgi:hypothetical protein
MIVKVTRRNLSDDRGPGHVPTHKEIQVGMEAMSKIFAEMGGQVYLDADTVKASNSP